MRIGTIVLALPLAAGIACKTTQSSDVPTPIGQDASLQKPPAARPPPVAATERQGNSPASRPENQPGSGVGATAPGQPSGTAVNGSSAGGDTSAKGTPEDQNPQSTAQASNGFQAGTDNTPATPNAYGTPATGSAGSAAPAAGANQVVTGKVGSVSSGALTINANDGTQQTLDLAPETTIRVNGQDARYTDLAEGLPVRASFNSVGDRNVAVDVRAGSGLSSDQSDANPSPNQNGFEGTPGAGGQPGTGGGGPGHEDTNPGQAAKRR